MKDLIIFGTGGLGRETAFLAKRINNVSKTWNILGFMEDTEYLSGESVGGLPILETEVFFEKYHKPVHLICALGDPKNKKLVVSNLSRYPNIQWATLIDPQAVVSPDIQVDFGTIIFPNTTITVNVKIGAHVLIYYNTSIAHDVIINDYVSINPGVNISGNVRIGTCSRMGVGSKVIEKLNIGDYVMVGAGAMVIRDVPMGKTVVGVPAKELIARED